ncbi:MAG TPA: hypothetical protein VKP60_16080, partial [Magnetospirillaceae bacterium]|nr:hypothetical protein [Magnetospirillaceae bacterium]
MRKAWLLLIPAFLIAVPLFGVMWLNSESGRHFVERQASSATVKVTGLTGSLPGQIRVARIELADQDGVWATIEDAALDWTPAALLRREASIQSLSARHVTISRQPLPEAGGSSGTPALPV